MYQHVKQWNGLYRVEETAWPRNVLVNNLGRADAKELAAELMTCECGHHLFVHYDTGPEPGCYGCAECPAGHRHAHRSSRLGHPFKDHCGCEEFKARTEWKFYGEPGGEQARRILRRAA